MGALLLAASVISELSNDILEDLIQRRFADRIELNTKANLHCLQSLDDPNERMS
jgi:hypothetical protein